VIGAIQSPTLGQPVIAAAKRKLDKYCEACSLVSIEFMPFAVDICGLIDQDAAYFLRKCVKKKKKKTSVIKSS